MTFPKSYDDVPPFEDYSLEGRTYRYAKSRPTYPFGYGLSYSRFEYSDMSIKVGECAEVSVLVRNAGDRLGDEVAQLYVRAPKDAGDRRVHHLESVQRVTLAPGEAKTILFRLDRKQFVVYEEDGRESMPDGKSTVFVGGGQPGFAPCLSMDIAP